MKNKIIKGCVLSLVLFVIVLLFGMSQKALKDYDQELRDEERKELLIEIQEMIDKSVDESHKEDTEVMLSIINYLNDRIETLEIVTGVTD